MNYSSKVLIGREVKTLFHKSQFIVSERLVSAAYAASSWKAMSCAKKLYKVFSSQTGISPL